MISRWAKLIISKIRSKPHKLEITNVANQLIDKTRFSKPIVGHHDWNSVPWTCYFNSEIEDWCVENCSTIPKITNVGYFTTHWDAVDENVNIFRYHVHFATQEDLMKFYLTWI